MGFNSGFKGLTENNSSSVVLIIDLDLPLYLHVAERETVLFTVEF